MRGVLVLAVGLLLSSVAAAADREPRRLQDGEPLPRYLHRDEIVAGLQATGASLQACLAGSTDIALRFSLSIGADGVVSGVWVEGDDLEAGAEACVVSALSAPSFAPHDEDPVAVSGSLATHGGVVLPLFALKVEERPLEVLFLYLPPDLDPDRRQSVAAELGHRQKGGSPAERGD